jgi:hypothetical protein
LVSAQERSGNQVVESLLKNLTTTSATNLKTSLAAVDAVLNRLRIELSDQAIGVILTKELQLDELASELRSEHPNPSALRSVERALRRLLPGKVQRTVNELRTNTAALARQVSSTPLHLDEARRAIEVVNDHFRDAQLHRTIDGEIALRAAFSTLAELHPSAADIGALRGKLSLPNYSSLIKKDFLIRESKRSFSLPIHFQKCQDNTLITGDGKFQVNLSLELPPSIGENLLRIHALGTGQINASADRSKVHVKARISPEIKGIQGVHLRPSEISGDTPIVDARLNTNLTGLSMDGLIGHSRLIRNVASRAVQKGLSANDPLLSEQIERTVSERVEEEGYQLAYRINGLLRNSLWDRIASLDFAPDVHLQNDSYAIRSDIKYARTNQLGALIPPPHISPEVYPSLDLITWVHESAVNNVLDSLSSLRLDEATVRGLWQVELKLTSDDWEKIQPAKIPAVIALADQSPLTLRLLPGTIEMLLRATACEIDGRSENVGPRELRIGYRVESDTNGMKFSRQEIGFTESIPAKEKAIWLKALDGFFAKTLRPLPKFRNKEISPLFRVGYLNIDQGWLVVGATRIPPATSPSPPVSKEFSR